MLVSCEKCHSQFKISQTEVDKISDEGRILKCGNCHHMWLATKSSFFSQLDNLTHQPLDEVLTSRLPKASSIMLTNIVIDEPIADFKPYAVSFGLRIIAYGLLFIAVVSFLISSKNAIFSKAAFLSPILNLMGLHDSRGLSITEVQIIKSSFEEGKPLIISGFITNNSDRFLHSPDIRINFIDGEGNIIKSVIHKLPKKVIAPGEKAKITNKIKKYPAEMEEVILDIASYLEFMFR